MLLLVPLAAAFSPVDHRAIAARALELEAERPGAPPDLREMAAKFPLAAANEDWNLPRKWTRWNHYYSLDFTVRSMGRRPSSERVAQLENMLLSGERDPWVLAGFIAHHVADMASPPHVVPIAHGLNDGFESYNFSALIASAGAYPVPDLPPVEAQRELVEDTVASLAVPLVCDTESYAWTQFWEPREGHFGTRGDLRFGDVPGCEAGTAAFARARVEEAVAHTRAVVRYVARLEGVAFTALGPDPPPPATPAPS